MQKGAKISCTGVYLYDGNPLMGTLTNNEDFDKMSHNVAFNQCLHCLLIFNQFSGTEIHYNW